MRCTLTLIFFTITYFFSQDGMLKKGNKAFVQQVFVNNEVKDYTDDFTNALQDWGYWKIVPSKDEADFIIDLNLDSHKGITLTSWGGQSVNVSATFHTKSGDKLYQTEKYESSPNGSNGFNAGQSSVKKLMRSLKKQFE